MKTKHFLYILIGIIIMMILTFALQAGFNEQTKEFGLSCGMFFLSTFCLICYKNALKPTETFGPVNLTKEHYERKRDLPKYQNLCKILFIITVSAGVLTLLGGLGEVLIHYLNIRYAG
ncbi:MAG: hypothetical protein IJX72_04330 [Clostridia bacterium]|nr:hypothetical protein [Clostridia bacterium]